MPVPDLLKSLSATYRNRCPRLSETRIQLFRPHDRLTRSLCSGPITGPSSLIRIGPSQCSASVLSPHDFRRLCFSLAIRALVPAVPRKSQHSVSRPLYAGRRLPSHQAPDRLVPEGLHTSGFGDAKFLNDASSMGSLSFVFRMHTCSRSYPELFLQRSPPRLFTAAAWSGLRPAPASRSRGTCPHLSRSFTTLFSPCCFPPFHVSLQHTVAQEVKTFFRYTADTRLILVHR